MLNLHSSTQHLKNPRVRLMKDFEAEAKQLLEAIVLEVGERNCEIEGHRLTRFKSACVSYKSIVEDYLEGVDLEPYRSSSHHWRIS